MKPTIYDYIETVTNNEMHAIALENSELNGELNIFNNYHRVMWNGAYYMVMSTINEFAAAVYGPYASIRDSELAAQYDFDYACHLALHDNVIA
jgi:hypothetical protein